MSQFFIDRRFQPFITVDQYVSVINEGVQPDLQVSRKTVMDYCRDGRLPTRRRQTVREPFMINMLELMKEADQPKFED